MKSMICNKLSFIELFAGAGGLAQGFLDSGHYKALALIDIEQSAMDTFRLNIPQVNYLVSDIRELPSERFRDLADGRRIVGLIGGPPCQGFSPAGLRNSSDYRNSLINSYARIVRALKPDFILLENVPLVVNHWSFHTLLDRLKPFYSMDIKVLNAAQYGIPQTRHRLFLLGYHRRLNMEPRLPQKTHDLGSRSYFGYIRKRLLNIEDGGAHGEVLGADSATVSLKEYSHHKSGTNGHIRPLVTVGEAIGDLEGLRPGKSIQSYLNAPVNSYQTDLRKDSTELFNHKARFHSDSMLNMINQIKEGSEYSADVSSNQPKNYFSQAYGRLHMSGLARTITTFFLNPGSGRFIHPRDDRAITVREAARLQSFKDSFVFIGNQEQQMRLVGNAVPPLMAKAIAAQIYNQIGELLHECD